MKYLAKEIKQAAYINWAKNLAADLEGKREDKNEKNLFPNSNDGDVATAKDLVGNFIALLTGGDFEIS